MNVGLLGCGHIASALARGWVRQELPVSVRPSLLFFDIAAERATELAGQTGGQAVASVAELVAGSEAVVVAVPPKKVGALLTQVAPALGQRPLVSVAAGISVDELRAQLPTGAAVGRVMPNVNVALGKAALLFAEGSLGAAAPAVAELFALVGEVVPIGEDLFDAATAVGGCGPGFVALFVEALETAGVAAGLSASASRTLAQAAFTGTSMLISAEGDPATVRRAICTPGGMTAAGVAALEDRGVPAAIGAAVRAAIARAGELA
jgi:pyrroline-5-carboxylate reductase